MERRHHRVSVIEHPMDWEPEGETVRYVTSLGTELHRLVTWIAGRKVVESWSMEPVGTE